ncbi:hypothetical protein FRC12_014720 [Ceratobasidium sp. 428]|nr:hypothetical protein FRC12_014720 [Ceratobasidium sp. 428]
MHICELATREEATTEQISMDLELLLPHLHRIEVLDIESYSYSRKLAGSILNLWLQNGNPALAKSLLISRPNAALVLSSTGSGRSVTIMSHSANSQAILQSLKGLHLQNVVFNWESVAYRGLVNLRLDFSRASIPVAISIHQLSDILSANPALSSLELGYLDIINSPDWSPIPTELYCLRILTLSFINSESLQLLLPLISLPKSPVEIGIGPTALDLICRELEDCLARAPNVTALKLRQDERHLFSNWLSFLRVLPRLSILALDNFHMSNEPAIETNIGDHVSCPDPHLSLVLLMNCTVTLEGLHILVREHNVQILHLERCGTLVEDQNTLEDTRTYLLAARPNLSCTISSVSEIEHLEFSRMLSL